MQKNPFTKFSTHFWLKTLQKMVIEETYLRIVKTIYDKPTVQFSSSVVSDSATSWTAAHQPSLSITNSHSPPKPMSIELVMPSKHLILYHPLLLLPQSFPASGSFQMSQLFTSGGQSIGVSASASVLPVKTQDWSPLGWTGWISLQSMGLSRSSHY